MAMQCEWSYLLLVLHDHVLRLLLFFECGAVITIHVITGVEIRIVQCSMLPMEGQSAAARI